MTKWRRAKNTDSNQADIVKWLRRIPNVTVEPSHDDILVGCGGFTFWYELKDENVVSKKTGEIYESKIKPKQKDLRENWKGHYKIVWNYHQIIDDMARKVPWIAQYR